MKKALIILASLFVFGCASAYKDGWNDGFEKGIMAGRAVQRGVDEGRDKDELARLAAEWGIAERNNDYHRWVYSGE